MKKKLLVVLLAMAMVLCFAATALAAEGDPSVKMEADKTTVFLHGEDNAKVEFTITIEGTPDNSPLYEDGKGNTVTDENDAVTKLTAQKYVAKITPAKNDTYIENGKTHEVTVDTDTPGRTSYKAELYIEYKAETRANTESTEWSEKDNVYRKVSNVSADTVTVEVLGGLDSAVVSTSVSNTRTRQIGRAHV